MATDVKQIKRAFSDYECADVSVWDSAAGLAVQLAIEPKELAEKYELFVLNKKKLDQPITMQLFNMFADSLKQQKAKENVPTGNIVNIEKRRPITPVIPKMAENTDAVMMDGTAANKAEVGSAPARTAEARFAVQPLLNGNLPDIPATKAAKCAHLEGPHLSRAHRTLSNYLPAVAHHLEHRINAAEACMRRSGHKLTAVNTGSEADVAVAGRVCFDSANTSVATLQLEGSRSVSDGARVKLDCSLLDSFSLFPGQVVGILGRNPTGSCLTAHKIIDDIQVGSSAPARVADHQSARVVVAAGPFTPATTLDFSALHAVLSYCRSNVPDVVLFCGPFIPDNHPELPNMETSFQDFFAQQVVAPVKEFCREHKSTQVLLQPATSDAHHLPVHPQPPFPASAVAPAEALPSPAHLYCGATLFSVSSSGLFMNLSATEVGKQAPGGDKVSTLFKHVLKQRHMYPVFPPAQDSCVDFAHTDHLELSRIPSVLVLPSPFPPCAKVVDAPSGDASPGGVTHCVNPGFACKGTSGTFVDLHCPGGAFGAQDANVSKIKACSIKWTSGSK